MIRKLNSSILWVPGIFDIKGGIQSYIISIVSALQLITKPSNIHVFTKNDIDLSKLKSYSEQINWYLFSKIRCWTKVRYGFKSLFKSLKIYPDILICAHINFSNALYPLIYFSKAKTFLICYGIECWGVTDFFKKKVMSRVSCTISISKYTRDKLINNNYTNNKNSYVLPVTFDESKFEISIQNGILLRKKLKISDKSKVILTVARLSAKEKYKGYDRILQVLPRLLLSEPSLLYIIVGKGDDIQRIQSMIKDLDIEKHVYLAGFVPDDELPYYYNACDIFCMPSIGEGFGIVFLEAMLCGKIVIGGKLDGTRDALCDGDLGFLVDPYDLEQLHDTILLALKRKIPHRLAYDSEKLRQEVIRKYGFEAFLKRFKEILICNGLEV